MRKRELKRLLMLNLPYAAVGLVATNLGEAWRLAEGDAAGEKILSLIYAIPQAFGSPFPSLHPLDLLIGLLAEPVCGWRSICEERTPRSFGTIKNMARLAGATPKTSSRLQTRYLRTT